MRQSTLRPRQQTQQQGFTLIELLVSVTLSILLIGAGMGLFFITLRSDSKKNSISDLKNNGDYAMNQMEFLLRNAVSLEKVTSTATACSNSMDEIMLKSIDNGVTHLYAESGKIASKSVTTGTIRYLTGDATEVSNLQFDCTQVLENVGTRINVRFKMDFAPAQGAGQLYNETATEDFETTINIRSL